MGKCKITRKKNKDIIHFGKMPIANGFLDKKDFKNEFFFNMTASFSEDISLLQLNDHPKPKMMFNKDYPFFTSTSEFMKVHFKDFAKWIKKKYLKPGGKIIELGSNDGTFLKNFPTSDFDHVGFEPSRNVSLIAKKNKVNSLNEFFSRKNMHKAKKFIGKTDIICGANVVCHIPDLVEFIKTCDLFLNSDGKIIFEEPYLGSVYNKTSYDQIYDEHIFIFSISSIKKIFELYDFQLIDAIKQTTHGGSMRYVLQRKRRNSLNLKIKKLIENEKLDGVDSMKGAVNFKKNCEISKEKLIDKLYSIKKKQKTICGYAATSKSTTILNYCDIGPDIIDCIFDTTPNKIGKYSPGKHIPIIDHKYFSKNFFDYSFLFAWNHSVEIKKKESKYIKRGGNWLTHL